IEKVGPALEDIREQLGTNAYLRELAGTAADQTTPLLLAGLAVGFATTLGVQDLLAAAIEAAFPTAAIAARGSRSYFEGKREASAHQLFFLYKANALL